MRGPNLFLGLPQPAGGHRGGRLREGWFAHRRPGHPDARRLGADRGPQGDRPHQDAAGSRWGRARWRPRCWSIRPWPRRPCTGEPDDRLGERIVAWVVLRPGASVERPEADSGSTTWPRSSPHTSAPARSASWTGCPATRWARCASPTSGPSRRSPRPSSRRGSSPRPGSRPRPAGPVAGAGGPSTGRAGPPAGRCAGGRRGRLPPALLLPEDVLLVGEIVDPFEDVLVVHGFLLHAAGRGEAPASRRVFHPEGGVSRTAKGSRRPRTPAACRGRRWHPGATIRPRPAACPPSCPSRPAPR